MNTEKEICIVPTYKREPLLFLCLEAIKRCDPNMRTVLFSDRGYSSSELNRCVAEFEVPLIVREPHNTYGNSWNVLQAMDWALKDPEIEIVHLVEEDTIVYPGYFQWARRVLDTGRYACVCGRMSEIKNWYESPCVSWASANLRAALSHLRPEYFAATREEMQKFLDQTFPNSPYYRGGAEQDGFFLRVVAHYHWNTLFPSEPLAAHLGWYGYNQPPTRTGPGGDDFDAKVKACREVFGNMDVRRLLFGHRIANREHEGWIAANRHAGRTVVERAVAGED